MIVPKLLNRLDSRLSVNSLLFSVLKSGVDAKSDGALRLDLYLLCAGDEVPETLSVCALLQRMKPGGVVSFACEDDDGHESHAFSASISAS